PSTHLRAHTIPPLPPPPTPFPYTTLFRSLWIVPQHRPHPDDDRVRLAPEPMGAPSRRLTGNPLGRPVEIGDLAVERHRGLQRDVDRKSTRLNSSHLGISYAVFCLKKKIV